jgi:hypothetical protein
MAAPKRKTVNVKVATKLALKQKRSDREKRQRVNRKVNKSKKARAARLQQRPPKPANQQSDDEDMDDLMEMVDDDYRELALKVSRSEKKKEDHEEEEEDHLEKNYRKTALSSKDGSKVRKDLLPLKSSSGLHPQTRSTYF